MSNSVAEAYLLILRSSMIPVAGEAVPLPFNEQIEIDEWEWTLKNELLADRDTKKDRKGGKSASVSASAKKEPAFKGDELIRSVTAIQKKPGLAQDKRDQQVRDLIQKAADQAKSDTGDGDDDAGGTGDEDSNKLQFTFKKSVDLASTQLLNAMKSGETMPRAVLTLFHRSKSAPLTLTITFGDVRLTKCAISVDVTDTMADLKEDWTATFLTVDYAYQNRPAASGPNGVTRGTARVFKKNLKKLF